jgi:hypothetical protein
VAKARPRYKATDEERHALKLVTQCIEEARRWHTTFSQKVDRRYGAWRGMQAENAPKNWRSNVHQPLLINVVEGMMASMEEAVPNWLVKGRAVPGMSMEEAIAQGDRAELCSHLIAHQMRVDDFAEKQSPFMLQDLIAGYTPGKISWVKEEVRQKYLDEQPELIYDENGGSIDIAMKLDEWEVPRVLRDDPSFEPRDVRDFLFPESAKSLDSAPWVIDRTFVHYKTLERMQHLGVYKNVEFVKETRADTTRRGADVVGDREQRVRSVDRTRGLVEVCEYWDNFRVITVANRNVVIRDEPNPNWHGKKPFVVCSAIPDMFVIPGVSVIEGLAQMQEMVWTLQNTRLDATRMLANPVTLVRGDVENADEYEWAPLAQWIVPDPNAASILAVDPALAQMTIQHEALLKGDIQNVMGGLPYTGGAESQTLDQKTATGISIVTNIAQAILQRRKQHYLRAFGKIGSFFLSLDQQLIREERLIEIMGEGGASRYAEVNWPDIQGIYDVSVEFQGDSMMRQERRAESGALLTQAIQSAPIMAQFGAPLNLRRFWEKHLETFDVIDKMTYFAPPQPSPLQPGLAGGQPGAGTPPGADALMEDMGGGGGVTNAELAAGPTAPSNDNSMSGAAAMSRALASSGAGRSV